MLFGYRQQVAGSWKLNREKGGYSFGGEEREKRGTFILERRPIRYLAELAVTSSKTFIVSEL